MEWRAHQGKLTNYGAAPVAGKGRVDRAVSFLLHELFIPSVATLNIFKDFALLDVDGLDALLQSNVISTSSVPTSETATILKSWGDARKICCIFGRCGLTTESCLLP